MIKRFMRWWWLRTNPREPKRASSIWSLFLMWMYPGIFLGMFIMVSFLLVDTITQSLIIFGIGVVITALLVWVCYDNTKQMYDIDKIHEAAVAKWHQIRKKYGVE